MTTDDDALGRDDVVLAALRRGLDALETSLDDRQLDQLNSLISLLSDWAPRVNLTGHQSPIEMTSRLVLDALALARTLPELEALSTLVDLGSGAGFPGLPIAILHPHLRVHLVDSRRKRNHFQREAKRQLKLANVQSHLGRSDDLSPIRSDAVVAQAMAQPPRAIELMLPWARPGGLLVLPASSGSDAPPLPPQLTKLEQRSYSVPESGIQRLLWVARVRD